MSTVLDCFLAVLIILSHLSLLFVFSLTLSLSHEGRGNIEIELKPFSSPLP
jgi:hypothetical protein